MNWISKLSRMGTTVKEKQRFFWSDHFRMLRCIARYTRMCLICQIHFQIQIPVISAHAAQDALLSIRRVQVRHFNALLAPLDSLHLMSVNLVKPPPSYPHQAVLHSKSTLCPPPRSSSSIHWLLVELIPLSTTDYLLHPFKL